ncbi:ankyrin repeat domain-containing protein [Streptomyces sp. NPDC006540]|uniref:ankyrin repeat domain-containing protein n=1 Tax=Streptomyces sp. NPDC006540 TaxID=3155353 RepID=UPI0033A9EE88
MTNQPAAQEPAAAARELFEAFYNSDDDAVVRLLRAGTDPQSTDEDGRTALYLAATSNEAGIVRLLLAAGADPDRACGPEDGDLPLCGAAVWGHTEAVRALLAAGAAPDRRELLGFTPMIWAVGQGRTETVEALLEYGADPDLPGPAGEAPLVLAARRGSPSTVRALLRHGAGARAETLEEALEEARRWMTLDVEEELRRGLLAYEPGAETVSRRVEEDGGATVVVEVLHDGKPTAGNEQQTGHGAIATLLEERLGLRTPYAALAERALLHGSPERDEWIEAVTALWRRGDEETFLEAAAGCAGDDVLRQTFAADVLGRLGFTAGPDGQVVRPFAARALPMLRELSREATDPELLQAVLLGLGHHGDPAALPEILRHADNPDAAVRLRVALALVGLVPGDHAEAVRTLITLTKDELAPVRDWATTALAGVDADTPEIRDALAARAEDPDPETVAEAARGLAMRQDPRAEDVLVRLLADEDPDGYAHDTAANAVRHLRDERLRRRLEGTLPRRP